MRFFENIIFTIPLLTGFIYLIAGWFLQNRPPEKINSMYGYRTKASFQSQKHWDFAQKYSAKLLIKCGIASILFSFLGFVFPGTGILETILVVVFCFGICAVVFIYTEKALKAIE